MSTELIRPAHTLQGSVVLPGDKSISHRYALLAGLAHGTSRIANFSTGADPHSSLACVEALGAKVDKQARYIEVTGTGGIFQQPSGPLDCGNSGSTMRMLAGLIASHPGTFTLIGDHSLTLRPMERIRKPLAAMGAKIDLTCLQGDKQGHAPITIHGTALRAIDFDTPIPSAQVKTAVLFAGLQATGTTSLSEAITTRDHSEHALRAFGAKLTRTAAADGNAQRLSIAGGQPLHATDFTIPGDLSSAAFFLCAALLFPDSNLILDAVGLNPTRSALLDVVAALGAKIRPLNIETSNGELVGTLQINANPAAAPAKPYLIEGALTAQLIDELPVLAAIAPYTPNGLIIRNAEELRVKESDRIDLVARNLRAMGATLTENPDGHGAQIDSGADHRIAMAFSIAALRATSDTEITGAEAAAISFPEFFTLLRTLTAN
jgi:3-phosphoshikimate 1-carboxyvinyltransferase